MSSDTTDRPVTLAFHKLTSSLTYGSTNYSPRRFRMLMKRLAEAGFGFEDQAERPLLVTFDDGYAHLAETLPPCIEQYGVRPIVFVPTAWIGRSNDWDYSRRIAPEPHLSAPQMQQLCTLGVQFGSHGHSHRDLVTMADGELRDELVRSKATIEDIVGGEVAAISYPFGRYDARVMVAAEAAGYRQGYSMSPPRDDDAALAVGRVAIYMFDTPGMVVSKVENSGLAPLWHGLARTAGMLSGGTVLLQKVGILSKK